MKNRNQDRSEPRRNKEKTEKEGFRGSPKPTRENQPQQQPGERKRSQPSDIERNK